LGIVTVSTFATGYTWPTVDTIDTWNTINTWNTITTWNTVSTGATSWTFWTHWNSTRTFAAFFDSSGSDGFTFVTFAAFAFTLEFARGVSVGPNSWLVVGAITRWFWNWNKLGGWDNDWCWLSHWWEIWWVFDWAVLAVIATTSTETFFNTVRIVSVKG